MEIAECVVYNTMRSCARAFRAFSSYDLQKCLDELEGLDAVQQRTPWVMALVGRAEYEKGDYAAVRSCVPFVCLFVSNTSKVKASV